jgi:hypothetical protein
LPLALLLLAAVYVIERIQRSRGLAFAQYMLMVYFLLLRITSYNDGIR